MTGTSASLREAPPRRFENYILTRAIGAGSGLTQIHDSLFTQVPGNVGSGLQGDAQSSAIEIGFDFSFDRITYKHWVACTNGWLALVDPSLGTFSHTEALAGTIQQNEQIRPTFTSDAVFLCPWFSTLYNNSNLISHLSSILGWNASKVDRISAGLEAPPTVLVNPSSYAVSYYVDPRSDKGRRLIVRWSSISNFGYGELSGIKFEVVLYENGQIEFRYAPRNELILSSWATGAQTEAATIGIFMPNGTNRFRDFAIGLGYRDDIRTEYQYGGYEYSSTYVDTLPVELGSLTASYTIGLTPYRTWPGLWSAGCTYYFSPPVNRRKVLPRQQLRTNDSQNKSFFNRTRDARVSSVFNGFDDRRSINFNISGTVASTVVNYPSTLQRFFGGTSPGTLERQNVFSTDFLVTGSSIKHAVEQFIGSETQDTISSFTDSARPEQDFELNGYYATGSSLDRFGSFNQSLRSKIQVRLSLIVDHNIQMPANSSSIYYYNTRTHSWEVPANSTYETDKAGGFAPSPVLPAGGDWANPFVDGRRARIVEDARGFGPIGNVVASGSHTPSSTGDQTDAVIGSDYVAKNLALVVGKEYTKSVQVNSEYRPVDDETFTLPITYPFLIEKAVFEIPLAAGPGWFADLTQCFLTLTGSSFDFAGPALTIALHRAVKLSEGTNTPSRRDLILTGTITHTLDNTSSVVIERFVPYDHKYQIRNVGFLSYASAPGGLVSPNSSSYFTGSVQVTAEALSAVGPVLSIQKEYVSSSAAINRSGVSSLLTETTMLQLTSSLSQSVKVAYVSPFGRGGTGFDQAGRCVLGSEYVTFQGLSDQTGQTITNPFYLGTSNLSAQQTAILAATSSFSASAITAVSLIRHFPSPYLVMPNDRLVLSISKMRPVMYIAVTNSGSYSGSIQHDVQLFAGAINVTLYGSMIKEAAEFHEVSNQAFGSDAVHEIIGAEPVLDQFEVAYRNEYTGSFNDDYVIGDISSGPGRYRRLSKLNARNASQLGTTAGELVTNPSKAFRAEPWHEMVGSVRCVPHNDSSERFYDSMMPSLADCFAADGTGIFVASHSAFGSPTQIDVGISGAAGIDTSPYRTRIGWLLFDYGLPSLFSASLGPIINVNWSKSFPYEPRYNEASRQIDVSRSFLATYFYNPSASPAVVSIPPRSVSGFAFGTTQLGTNVLSYDIGWIGTGIPGGPWDTTYYANSIQTSWVVDSNLSALNQYSYYSSGSANIDDMARGLFGFGDKRTYFRYVDGANTVLLGTGHFVDSRDQEGPHPDGRYIYYETSAFTFSPRIRGWKYGVYSGIPAYSKCYFRHGRFGQFRDMLEQRLNTKYYQTTEGTTPAGVQPSVVLVNFVHSGSITGSHVSPEDTQSNNQSFECTSSLPFFDGRSSDRPAN